MSNVSVRANVKIGAVPTLENRGALSDGIPQRLFEQNRESIALRQERRNARRERCRRETDLRPDFSESATIMAALDFSRVDGCNCTVVHV